MFNILKFALLSNDITEKQKKKLTSLINKTISFFLLHYRYDAINKIFIGLVRLVLKVFNQTNRPNN